MRRLVDDALGAGWRVALWALDEPDPALAAHTVGRGGGQRTALLNRLVERAAPEPGDDVVVSDDDVEFVDGSLPAFLALVHRAGLGLAQPAHDMSSAYSYDFTVAQPASVVRLTGFVEVGPVVAITAAARPHLLPLPDDFGMGWGLPLRWSAEAGERYRMGIVDAVRLVHHGEVAAEYDSAPERRRVAGLLEAYGLDTPTDIQRTLAVWRHGEPAPPWRPT